jgi:Domain of unknown function (DUF222)
MLGTLDAAVEELVGRGVGAMCDSEIRETYVDLRRNIDRLEACASLLLAGADGRGIPSGDGASSTPVWVRWQTGQRVSEAKASLEAGRVCEILPLTAKAWRQGEISSSAARTICRGIKAGHEDVYASIEHQLVGSAALQNLHDLDGLIRHYQTRAGALHGTEPSELNGVHLSRVGNRFALSGDLDELTGMTVDEALLAATDKPAEDDTRGPAKKRADALTRVCRFFLDQADLPVEGASGRM